MKSNIVHVERVIDKGVELYYILDATSRKHRYADWHYDKDRKKWVLIKHYLNTKGADKGAYIMSPGWLDFIIDYNKSKKIVISDGSELEDYLYSNFTDVNDWINSLSGEFRGTQAEDLMKLMRYRRGIMSIYTGYGKTTLISYITKYMVSHNKSVIIMAPNYSVLEEIKLRVESLLGISLKIGCNDLVHLVCCNGNIPKNLPYRVDAILSDEVEHCTTSSAELILQRVSSTGVVYGFSGTADKATAGAVDSLDSKSRIRNSKLISLYGPTRVYRKPKDKSLSIYSVTVPWDVRLSEREYVNYSDYRNALLSSKNYLEAISSYEVPDSKITLIAINSRSLVSKYSKALSAKGYDHAIITGSGVSKVVKGVKSSSSLKKVKSDAASMKYKYLLGTKSVFRGIDIPEINTVYAIDGVSASTILQIVGRAVRLDHANLVFFSYRNSKLLLKQNAKRLKLVKNYFNECKIEVHE